MFHHTDSSESMFPLHFHGTLHGNILLVRRTTMIRSLCKGLSAGCAMLMGLVSGPPMNAIAQHLPGKTVCFSQRQNIKRSKYSAFRLNHLINGDNKGADYRIVLLLGPVTPAFDVCYQVHCSTCVQVDRQSCCARLHQPSLDVHNLSQI